MAGECGSSGRGNTEALSRAAGAGATHEQQRASRPHRAGGMARDLECQQHVLVEHASRLREVHLAQACEDGLPAVTITWSIGVGRPRKNCSSAAASVASNAARPQGAELTRHLLEALGSPRGQDDVGPLAACSPGRFQSDAGAPADHDDGLAEQFRLAPD